MVFVITVKVDTSITWKPLEERNKIYYPRLQQSMMFKEVNRNSNTVMSLPPENFAEILFLS